MPDTPTPGQVAYAAYNTSCGFMHQPPWEDLRVFERRAWEAAAEAVLASRRRGRSRMHRNWVHRIHATMEEAGQPLRAKTIAIRCGCVGEDEYASVRHALRRELAKGHLRQNASGYYRRGVCLKWEAPDA